MTPIIEDAIRAVREGDKATGQRLLAQIIRAEPDNERAWFWLAEALDDPLRKQQSLQRVLQLNPENQTAHRRLAALTTTHTSVPAPEIGKVTAVSGKAPVSPTKLAVPTSTGQPVVRIPTFLVAAIIIVFAILTLVGIVAVSWARNRIIHDTGASSVSVPTLVQQATVPATYTPIPLSQLSPATDIPFAQPTYTPVSTYTPLPTSTAYPTQVVVDVLPSLTPIQQFSGSEAEFRAYIYQKYNTIGEQSLQIADVTIFNEGGEFAHYSVSIQLTEASAALFSSQPPSAAAIYAENLLQDAIRYFDGQDCLVRVYELFYTDYLADRYFDDDWYYIGDYDIDDGWPIYRDYIWGIYTDGRATYNIWNGQ